MRIFRLGSTNESKLTGNKRNHNRFGKIWARISQTQKQLNQRKNNAKTVNHAKKHSKTHFRDHYIACWWWFLDFELLQSITSKKHLEQIASIIIRLKYLFDGKMIDTSLRCSSRLRPSVFINRAFGPIAIKTIVGFFGLWLKMYRILSLNSSGKSVVLAMQKIRTKHAYTNGDVAIHSTEIVSQQKRLSNVKEWGTIFAHTRKYTMVTGMLIG